MSFAVALALGVQAQPEPAAEQRIGAPDVFQAVRLVHFELVALGHVTGKPRPEDEAMFVVVSAAQRHAFYHAQVLFRKTHQLAEEIAGGRQLPLEAVNADWRRAMPRPVPEGREVVPADVLQLVTDTADRVKAILALLNVRVAIQDPPARDADIQPADVLAEIMKIKRLINRMMDRPFQMRDVYERVRASINHAGDLGAGYVPQTPAGEAKQPLEVYRRLIDCLHLVRQVGAAADVKTLDWEDNGGGRGEVLPADVYDLATTVLSELDYLTRHIGADRTSLPRGEYRTPREVLAEHVFALVGVLEAQLNALADDPQGSEKTGVSAVEGRDQGEARPPLDLATQGTL